MKKVAVVVGGFGNLGYAVSQELAKMDYAVVVLSRSAESTFHSQKMDALETDAKLAISCDITDSVELEKARSLIVSEFSGIDVLVNCAGWTKHIQHDNFAELADDVFDKVVSVQLRAVFATIKTFNPHLNDDSVIVNISSASAFRRGGSNLAYAAAKAGVDSLTRNLALVMAPKTRVVAVAPGFIDSSNSSSDLREVVVSTTPLKRVASPADIVGVVVSMINNKFINGTIVPVDGGRSI